MRATSLALAALAVVGVMAACSQSDRSDMSSDARDAAHSATTEATKVANDADMKRTEADLKHLGHVAAQDVRKGAAEAKAATRNAQRTRPASDKIRRGRAARPAADGELSASARAPAPFRPGPCALWRSPGRV